MAVAKKEEQRPTLLGDKITLYAPMQAIKKDIVLQHEPGEEVNIHPAQKAHFESLGYTETAPDKTAAVESKGKSGAPGTMTNGGSKN